MDALQVAAEPRRRQILRLVAGDELPAGEIAARLGATFSATSQHLGRLRKAGLVTMRRDGRRRLYRANAARLGEVARALEASWSTDLDRLARLAEQLERAGGAAGEARS